MKIYFILFIIINKSKKVGIGDWGLGIGDWGLGIGPNPQSPISNYGNYYFIFKFNFIIN